LKNYELKKKDIQFNFDLLEQKTQLHEKNMKRKISSLAKDKQRLE
jgi:hypothetical protein